MSNTSSKINYMHPAKNASGQTYMLKKILDKLRLMPVEAMLLFLAMGISLLGDSSLYILLPIYADDIGIPIASVGILLSINRFIRLGTNYYVQWLNRIIGSRKLFLLSIILAAVTTLCYGLPAGFLVLAVSRALWGGCWSAMRLVCLTKVGEYSSDATRGTLTGVFNSTVRLGSLAATLLGGILAELAGFRNTYYIFAAGTLIIGLPLVIFSERQRRLLNKEQKEMHAGCEQKGIHEGYGQSGICSDYEQESTQEGIGQEDIHASQNGAPAVDNPGTVQNPKRTIGLRAAYILAFLNSWIGSGLLSTTISYILKIRFGSDIDIFAVSIGISVAASFLASLKWVYGIALPVFFGRISDRYGRFNLIVITGCIQVLSLMIIALAHSFLMIAVGIVIAFAASTALTSILDATAVDHHCMAEKKNILGSFMTWNDLGAAIGAIAGYSLTVALGYNIMYLLSASVLLLVIGVIGITYYRMSIKKGSEVV